MWARGKKADCPITRAAIREALNDMKGVRVDLDILFPEDVVDFFRTMSGSAMTNPELLLSGE